MTALRLQQPATSPQPAPRRGRRTPNRSFFYNLRDLNDRKKGVTAPPHFLKSAEGGPPSPCQTTPGPFSRGFPPGGLRARSRADWGVPRACRCARAAYVFDHVTAAPPFFPAALRLRSRLARRVGGSLGTEKISVPFWQERAPRCSGRGDFFCPLRDSGPKWTASGHRARWVRKVA